MKRNVLKKLNALVKSVANQRRTEKRPIVHRDGIIGSDWEVKKLDKNSYCIVCSVSNDVIVKDIELYEVAYNVAYLINKGYSISSLKVTEIIKHHDHFSQKFHEAIYCKEKRNLYGKQGDVGMYDLMDAKYKQARMLAVESKKKLHESYQNR
jgi:hypothetical protein